MQTRIYLRIKNLIDVGWGERRKPQQIVVVAGVQENRLCSFSVANVHRTFATAPLHWHCAPNPACIKTIFKGSSKNWKFLLPPGEGEDEGIINSCIYPPHPPLSRGQDSNPLPEGEGIFRGSLKTVLKKIALIVVILLYTELSFANCTYNGVNYPSGTVLGPYVCSGTEWVVRR